MSADQPTMASSGADSQTADAGTSAEASERQQASDHTPTSVVMLPDYTEMNPYQSELAAGLREHNHDVSLSYGAVLPILRSKRVRGADVVHFHWLQNYILADNPVIVAVKILQFFVELLLYRFVFGGTVVWTIHNRMEHKKRWPGVERRVKRLFLLYFCDRAIVHCERARREIIREFDLPDDAAGRIDVVPHGHYVDSYENTVSREDAREQLAIPADETVFLFIGSIRPYKQVPRLVEAFENVAQDEARLVIAGKPWNDSVATGLREQCADLDAVSLRLEIVPESEFQVYLNAADAAVFPFREDTLTSGSVILAMSFGTAVVAPEIGCLPETLPEDGAVLYDHSDDDGLERALETAAEGDLTTMGARNYERITEFGWDRIAAATADVYDAARGTDDET